jgi:hypothetical protein
MSRTTSLELKELKRVLRAKHGRTRDYMYKVALDTILDRKTLVYSEIDIQNIDKIMYKTYKESNNKLLQDAPTIFNNLLLSFVLDDMPACFTVKYEEDGRLIPINVCSFHIATDDEGKSLVSVHYTTKDKKPSHKVRQVVFKTDGDHIYSFGESNSFKSKMVSFAYSLLMLVNRYSTQMDTEELTDDESLSRDINAYFQEYVKDSVLEIEKSKEDMDLSSAISMLGADDDDDALGFVSNS